MNVSLNFRQSAYASETQRVLIALMTFEHPGLSEPVRISSDPTARIEETAEQVIYGTVSRGNTFVFFPIRIKLPDDSDQGQGEMGIEIDNVNQDLVATIRSISGPIALTTEIVLDSALDDVEVTWPEFVLSNINYNALVISATLKAEHLEREPFPAGIFSPAYFKAMF